MAQGWPPHQRRTHCTAHPEAGGGERSLVRLWPQTSPTAPAAALPGRSPGGQQNRGLWVCAVHSSAGQGWVRALPGAKGLKILFPPLRLTGRRTPRSGRTSTSGEGGEGRARITGAEHRSGSKSQKGPSCWTLAVKRGVTPASIHLPCSVSGGVPFTTQYVM